MQLTGENYIGAENSGRSRAVFQAMNPVNNERLMPYFHEADEQEVNTAIEISEAAFRQYSQKSGNQRAQFLETIADEIMDLDDELINRAMQETGLPEARLTGERARTTNQLRLFGQLVREGSWVDARIDKAKEPYVHSMQVPLGPVGIFGASNFPLAFSVAGGDTASALAAGCPVIVKAHPAHPGTSELVAVAILNAVKKTGMPDGTFSMVHGVSHNVGAQIVNHPIIKAIGFTGSFSGGKALFDIAVNRMEPIPVYAEMGSTNPVFILPEALRKNSEVIAEGLTNSINLGTGQFCTKPGLVIIEKSKAASEFIQVVSEYFRKRESATMLTPGISSAYESGLTNLKKQEGVTELAHGNKLKTKNSGLPHLYQVDSASFLSNRLLEEEVFGPSALFITTENSDDFQRIAENLSGHLTATLFGTEQELARYPNLIRVLQQKAGRLIFNQFPTGVKVCHAMVHGGPFPSTTDSRSTSVGTGAITRFTRPVSFQNFPDSQLPPELRNDNPLNIWRLIDGERQK